MRVGKYILYIIKISYNMHALYFYVTCMYPASILIIEAFHGVTGTSDTTLKTSDTGLSNKRQATRKCF